MRVLLHAAAVVCSSATVVQTLYIAMHKGLNNMIVYQQESGYAVSLDSRYLKPD